MLSSAGQAEKTPIPNMEIGVLLLSKMNWLLMVEMTISSEIHCDSQFVTCID